MTQTGYSSDFRMGSGFCEFLSQFCGNVQHITGIVRFMEAAMDSARLNGRDAAGDIGNERDIVCAGAAASAG